MTDTPKDYRKTQHTLPSEVWAAFEEMKDRSVRDDYAVRLRGAGWTLQSISDAAGITRERVRQIVGLGYSGSDLTGQPVPEPPVREHKPKREYVEPQPEKLARLLELQDDASKARGANSEFAAAADEYTRLLAEVHLQDGVTLYRLGKRLGRTHGALRFRLARYGYKTPANGNSKVYKPLARLNPDA
jgi:hypothetical protein